jgi:hypothetical protein
MMELGNIVQVVLEDKIYTGRIIKLCKSDFVRVRFFNSDLEIMRIEEFSAYDLVLADEKQIAEFLARARAENIRRNLELGTKKRHEANSRRFD